MVTSCLAVRASSVSYSLLTYATAHCSLITTDGLLLTKVWAFSVSYFRNQYAIIDLSLIHI